MVQKPTLVAEQSKAWVCGRSSAKIAGSDPAGGMDVYVNVCCTVKDKRQKPGQRSR
jgi:hypothetical protein